MDSIVELLTERECIGYLDQLTVGRVGISVDALPAILPVNYMMLAGAILFRTSGASELYRASVGHVVCFEIDGYDDGGTFGWSVLVRGHASEITAPEEVGLARALWLDAWALGEKADRYIVIPATLISGRRFFKIAD